MREENLQSHTRDMVADVVKVVESENMGVRSSSNSRIAIGYILSGTKYIHYGDCCTSICEGEIFLLGAGIHYEENCIGENGRFESITFFVSVERLQQAIFGLNINYGLSFSSHHSCRHCNTHNFASIKADTPLSNFFLGIDLSLRNSGLLHNDVGQRIKLNELIYLTLSGEDGCVKRKLLRSADVLSGQFINVVHENIFNDVSVEMLASMTNRSLTAFKKEFRRLFGAPPHRWIIEQRLNRAKILLVSTSRTVSEIGAECGFSNISHFIKLFKQRYHTTPAAFRYSHSIITPQTTRLAE
ncbi:MAG: helix-turn-helix transcriptional regulator [Alistipes sp.]|nr:helix-turn-helix transcriptional regulator [Alistipes sp.]